MIRTTTILAILSAPALALAGPLDRIDVSVAAGGHVFSDNVELGVDDFMDEPGPSSSALFGGRFAFAVIPRLAGEAELVLIPTKDDVAGDSAVVLGIRAQARFDILTGKLRPFVVAGYGGHVIRGGSPQMDDDADQAYHWGGGVRYALGRRLDLRVDFRHLIVPDRTETGATSDFEASAGVAFKFGGPKPVQRVVLVEKPAPVVEPVVAAEPGDADGDGLRDDVDECRELPEDRDAFSDEDGCPDPDNDRDTVLDAADKCPLEPELMNDWEDEDGCPDELIKELTGIGFELNSAVIDVGSSALLDRAYEILSKNTKLRVEISGHTSADGNPERNLVLSLDRAEAVKDYLVARGIAEERIITVGHGSDKPVAPNSDVRKREQNRRIEFRILRGEENF
jgi:OOP family OmpA-OmpF porin